MFTVMEYEKGKGLGYLLERTTRLVKLNYSQAFKAGGFDVTPEQWVIMERLSEKEKMSQNQLAEFSFKDAPTISRILDLLSKKEIIKRSPVKGDKRSRHISLTAKGLALVEDMKPLVADLRAKSWNDLSDSDYENFVRIINQVFKNYHP